MAPDGADERVAITLDARRGLNRQAIDIRLAQQAQDAAAIRAGLDDAAAGCFASLAEVEAAVARWR